MIENLPAMSFGSDAQMMRSAKLESFFANNPREKSLMETCTRPTVVTVYKSAVANVPETLFDYKLSLIREYDLVNVNSAFAVPMSLRGATYSVGIKRKKKSGQRRRNKLQSRSSNQKAFKRKKNDPLRTFTI
ncbi:hypothetical protein DICVIV_01907 [Dictyocaulus viviparus]|uniref:Uncharacterized protein n=1 Tax=Dictyocaulus viviparus TaxID=29172 RepID=A0A0D8YBJ6_DICVI|nr:hypothetical protein DICVIV_01907 [Dictyocaulus viviparus]